MTSKLIQIAIFTYLLLSSVSASKDLTKPINNAHHSRFRVRSDGTRVLQRRCLIKDIGNVISNNLTTNPLLSSGNILGSNSGSAGNSNNAAGSGCFPSSSWVPPSGNPTASMSQWWCASNNEYGFMGFSYDISQCPSLSQLNFDFSGMKNYKTRYVRIYNNCDGAVFLDRLIQAAYTNGLGLYYTLWMGYGDQMSLIPGRINILKSALNNNPLAPYVIRTISMGSEAVAESGLAPNDFLNTMLDLKSFSRKWNIPITASDAAWITVYQNPLIWAAQDQYSAHVLPVYDPSRVSDPVSAYNGLVKYAINTFTNNLVNKKKFVLTQAPWPSSGSASNGFVGSLYNQQLWYQTIDSHCKDWKAMPGGGGYFYHLWSDIGSGMGSTSNYGILDYGNQAKWAFNPTINC